MTITVNRVKKSDTEVPKSLAEANAYVEDVGLAQEALDRLDCAMALAIEAIRAKAKAAKEPLLKERASLVQSIFVYATANRARLTEEGKTVNLLAGKFLWRFTPPATMVANEQALIETLQARGLGEFVRTHESLDRQSLLACRETLEPVPGLSFASREEFVVVPHVAPHENVVVVTHKID